MHSVYTMNEMFYAIKNLFLFCCKIHFKATILLICLKPKYVYFLETIMLREG